MNEKQVEARVRLLWRFAGRLVDELNRSGALTDENIESLSAGLAFDDDSEEMSKIVTLMQKRLMNRLDTTPRRMSDITAELVQDAQDLQRLFGEKGDDTSSLPEKPE